MGATVNGLKDWHREPPPKPEPDCTEIVRGGDGSALGCLAVMIGLVVAMAVLRRLLEG